MQEELEIELKEILKKEVILVEKIYNMYLKIKKNIEEKSESNLKEIISQINISLSDFKDLEIERSEVWKKFLKNKKFESTYEAIEKLATVFKKEIYDYFHRLRMAILNIKTLNYVIQNYVETSIDILEIMFQNAQESIENITYKNPNGPKIGSSNEASVLIDKKV